MAPERPAGPTPRLPVALKQHTRIIPRPLWVSLPWTDAGGSRRTADRQAAFPGGGTALVLRGLFASFGGAVFDGNGPSGKAIEEEACPQVRI